MKTPEEIKEGLIAPETFCDHCSYSGEPNGCNHPDGLCQAWTSADDAYELIQQLEERVPKWISVEERLPDKDSMLCLVFRPGKYSDDEWDMEVICYRENCREVSFSWADVTHWMPLPPAPKEG